MGKTITAVCPKCFELKRMTRHHIVPKRFRVSDTGKYKLLICRDCHDIFENILPKKRTLSVEEYMTVTRIWLRGGQPCVKE